MRELFYSVSRRLYRAYFDETVLEDGEVVCPNCGAKLEFDLSDLAAAAEDGEDEE